MKVTAWVGALATAMGIWSCSAARQQPASFPVEDIEMREEAASTYSTDPGTNGAAGPRVTQIEAEVKEMLAARGNPAQADSALGAAAAWALREVHQSRTLDTSRLEAVVRHFGFSGEALVAGVVATSAASYLREFMESSPSNKAINRYGIRVSPSGQSAAVVLGRVEASFSPLKRLLEPGESVTLKGDVRGKQTGCQVYLTKPDGTVDSKKPCKGRNFDETFVLEQPGAYRLELMGDGPEGPSILANLPLFVGVPEPAFETLQGSVTDPAQAEQRMLELLNRDRATAGAPPLRSDAELRAIALSHSEDMVDHNFFAHVSPSTGTPQDRFVRADLLMSEFGENIALGPSAEAAHQGLMDSPGHRMNMLNPRFTHVGIAAVARSKDMIVTLNFGRRPNPADVPTSTAQVESALTVLRQAKGLGSVAVDPVYRAGAQAAANEVAAGGSKSEVDEAAAAAEQREVTRLRSSRPAGYSQVLPLLELSQLERIPLLLSPELKRLGIGTKTRTTAKGTSLATVFISDGPACSAR
jgi:uncharacterized protein YkwD